MKETTVETVSTQVWTENDLRRLNEEFKGRTAEDLLAWATDVFEQEIVLTCSFSGISGMVLLDMIAHLDRGTPILFLDTDLLFPETYALAEAAAQRYGVMIKHHRPLISLEEQDRQEGSRLYARNPDRCCGIRKVAPMAEALQPYNAWISGIRRDQGRTREQTELVQWNQRHGVLKLNPLAYWSEAQVWAYVYEHNVPYNPLLDHGYTSIGCVPCTRPSSSDDPRAGRWAGFAKTECGIHL